MMFLISPVRHRRKAGLWWSISEVRTSWLGGHVLHLGGGADGLLAISGPTWGLMLGARLGRPHLNIEGGLARSWGSSIGGRDRLRRREALGLSHWAGRKRGGGWDSPSLGFGCSLLGSSQRWLGRDDHSFVSSHRSAGGRGRGRSGVLGEKKGNEAVWGQRSPSASHWQL